jgi:hypothetical protein
MDRHRNGEIRWGIVDLGSKAVKPTAIEQIVISDERNGTYAVQQRWRWAFDRERKWRQAHIVNLDL